ncbi:hypothetical protein GCM10009678_12450 [Actinomadura kijaniata]|uniref:MFS family permease n=1 Tax=Actinomadura namibiensis TaxID=182080 RepID=A0A7W3QLC4_ACTNM|nr:MFS family permease [Actinomadura namibiensis]
MPALTASLSPAERRGHDLATVMAGLTGAVVVGVPLGTWIGAAFGWRATFLLVGALGLGCLALTRAALPQVPPAPPRACPPACDPCGCPPCSASCSPPCSPCWATSRSRRIWRCSRASRPR